MQRASQAVPDIILLDALMPGMDGFEVARRLKAQGETSHIPIVFMTGLTETEHVVSAFDAGGIDYVIKPIKPRRCWRAFRRTCTWARQAGRLCAPDAFGHASVTISLKDGRLPWKTPFGPATAGAVFRMHLMGSRRKSYCVWFGRSRQSDSALGYWHASQLVREPGGAADFRLAPAYWRRRVAAGDDGDLRPCADRRRNPGVPLDGREGEVLYWVVRGKTNRDIGDILGSSPATVRSSWNIFSKLGVETEPPPQAWP